MGEFDFEKLDREVDDLLADVKGLLDEPEEDGAELDDPEEDETEPEDDAEAGEAEDAVSDDRTIIFRPLTAYEQSKAEYQTAKRAEYERARAQSARTVWPSGSAARPRRIARCARWRRAGKSAARAKRRPTRRRILSGSISRAKILRRSTGARRWPSARSRRPSAGGSGKKKRRRKRAARDGAFCWCW